MDQDGHAVLGTAGPVELPPGTSRIEVLGDGTIRTEAGAAGQLRIVRFEDQQALRAEGDRLLAAPDGTAPLPVERPGLVQGAVEGSNVRPVLEMTRMTDELRHFQFVAQLAEREGERLQTAVERILRRR